MLASLAKWSKNSRRPAECRRIRPQIESLEERRLMSATPLLRTADGWGIKASLDGTGWSSGNPSSDRDVYTFEAQAGDMFSLRLKGPMYFIHGGNGIYISVPQVRARIINSNVAANGMDDYGPGYTVLASGTVTIEVIDAVYRPGGRELADSLHDTIPAHAVYQLSAHLLRDVHVTKTSVNPAGTEVRFDYKAWGRLNGTAGDTFSAAVYESEDNVLDATDRLLVGPQEFNRGSGTGVFTLSKRPSLSYVFVAADPTHGIADISRSEGAIRETDEANNVVWTNLREIVVFAKRTPKGEGTHIWANDKEMRFQVGYFYSEDALFDASDLKFRAGPLEFNRVPRMSKVPSNPQRPFTLLVVDPYNLIAEGDESNNAVVINPPAGATYSSKTKQLTVVGNDNVNKLIVRQDAGRITLQGEQIYHCEKRMLVPFISAALVKKIHVEGRGGDDVIRLDRGVQPISATTFISGGLGNDAIFGGKDGRNVIYGGAGRDTITGGAKNDDIHGGTDNDSLYGLGGDDRLFGGDGNDDRLWGGADNDWLEAGHKDEFAFGGEKAEFFGGNAGNRIYDRDFNAHLWAVGSTAHGFNMEDVNQGHSKNCVFLASLAALAKNGWDLTNRIQYQGNFLYRVQLFENGQEKWQDIHFDGTKINSDPVLGFTEGHTKDFWVQLFARAFDRQNSEEWALIEQALPALTGRAAYVVDKTDKDWAEPEAAWTERRFDDSHFQLLQNSVNAGLNVVATTHTNVSHASLVGPHAYTVLEVTSDRRIKLRNPHGSQDFNNEDGLLELTWAEFNRDMREFGVDGMTGAE